MLILLFVVSALSVPLLKVSHPVANEYVLVFEPEVELGRVSFGLSRFLLQGDVMLNQVQSIGSYFTFAGVRTKNITNLLNRVPHLKYVEQNQRVWASQTCNTQDNAPWGIDRIDHSGSFLSGEFDYSSENDGEGVTAIIIDTGININHKEFEGRATWGTNTIDKDNTDGNGHGTHVAGTVGGTKYGIAKKCSLVAVKVLSAQGSGTSLSVTQGIQWSQQNKKDRTVLNLSLGGGRSTAQNDACDAAVKSGLVMIVAAGNSNADACNFSPASAKLVISVGASNIAPVPPEKKKPQDPDEVQEDSRASFSNWGSCVRIFAPGQMILSAWKGSSNAVNTISGTSMASPHVAGIAVAYWSQFPKDNNSKIMDRLLDTAIDGIVDLKCASSSCLNSANKLAHLKSCADKKRK